MFLGRESCFVNHSHALKDAARKGARKVDKAALDLKTNEASLGFEKGAECSLDR